VRVGVGVWDFLVARRLSARRLSARGLAALLELRDGVRVEEGEVEGRFFASVGGGDVVCAGAES
jgi:hypothetical protein